MTRLPPASRQLRRLAGVLAGAGVVACITVPEFRALERRVDEVQAEQATTGGGDSRVADLGADVTALQRETERLQGAVEEARHAAEQALRVSEEARRAAEEARRGSTTEGEPASGALPTAITPEFGTLSQEVRDYEEGSALYREERYPEAIDRLRTFLQNYPSSDYADNALFWIGESQFKLGEYERAVLTFEDVVKKYPDGNKVPDALYRQGVALLALGRRNEEEAIYEPAAREIFERIVKEYPKSDRVPEAQTQLEKLRL